MNIKQFIISRRRRIAKHKVYLRHRLVEKAVYLHAEIQDDVSTRMYLCINGVKILTVADMVMSQGTIPAVLPKDAQKVLAYIRHQYWLTHRHDILNPRTI